MTAHSAHISYIYQCMYAFKRRASRFCGLRWFIYFYQDLVSLPLLPGTFTSSDMGKRVGRGGGGIHFCDFRVDINEVNSECKYFT